MLEKYSRILEDTRESYAIRKENARDRAGIIPLCLYWP